jgi:hypothetical protein
VTSSLKVRCLPLPAVEMTPVKNREWTAACGAPNEVPARDILDLIWPSEDLTDAAIAEAHIAAPAINASNPQRSDAPAAIVLATGGTRANSFIDKGSITDGVSGKITPVEDLKDTDGGGRGTRGGAHKGPPRDIREMITRSEEGLADASVSQNCFAIHATDFSVLCVRPVFMQLSRSPLVKVL